MALQIYWMGGNLKWHHNDTVPFVKQISEFFDVVYENKLLLLFWIEFL